MNLVASPLLGFGQTSVIPPTPVDPGELTITDNGDGTVTFTYTNPSPSVQSTLWIRPFNHSNPWPWTDQGDITGDGSWTVSLSDGDYFAYVSITGSSTIISDIQFFTVSQYDGLGRWANRRDASFSRTGLPIVYEQYTSGTTNPRTGTVVKSFNSVHISEVIVSEVNDRDVAGSNGNVQIGDMLFRIRRIDCPDSPPDLRSQIVFDSTTYDLIWRRKSSDLYVWDVFGREILVS